MKTAKRILAVAMAAIMLACALPVSAKVDYKHTDHTDLALTAVTEGIVLLKNDDQALPLAEKEKIALFGNGQIYAASTTEGYQIGGGGSGWVSSMKGTPMGPAEALLEAEKQGKVSVYRPLYNAYKANMAYVPTDAMYADAAAFADTAIMFITRYSTEGADMDASKWSVSTAEKTMLKKLSSSFEKLVVILNTPSTVETAWSLDGNALGVDVDALLACYMGGQKGGEGMAQILTGEVNPSGKLTHTYAQTLNDYPTTNTFLENWFYVNYTEDIYVGYRYFETFADAKDKVVYPFGYGLSYTDFEITSSPASISDGKVTVNVTVKNTGSVAGKEVVQVYYSAPQAGVGSAVLSKSAINLACYQKTKLLAPGESQTLTLSYDVADMASFDDMGKTGRANCYVLEAGTYDILVGNSVRATKSAGTYTVDALTVVSEHERLLPTTLTNRLTHDGSYEDLPVAATTATADAAGQTATVASTADIDLNADNFTGITYADVAAGKATMQEMVAQMSYAELIGLCYGHEAGITMGTGSIGFASNSTAEKYGVYSADTADGPAGLRLSDTSSIATFWPCSTLQASMWNPEMIRKIGEAVGEECLKYNADIWLAPGINIHRNPLCGRNFEYYSEDPVVAGVSAAALINGVQSKGVGCSIKHFALNNKETARHFSDSRVSEKAMREIYLKGFKIAIEDANPMFVMTSYNLINGVYTSTSADLIKGILRGEWGYTGLITSDWDTTPGNLDEVLAGNNVKMPVSTGEPEELKKAVQDGRLSREVLEENAVYVLNALVKLPDHTLHATYVNEISANGKTVLSADEYSRKAYQIKFDLVGNDMCVSYTDYKDEIDGSYPFIEFTVSVDTPGTYALTMNYAAPHTVRNAFDILVNGETVEGLKKTLTNTKDWSVFADKSIGQIHLDEGVSTIRIRHAADLGVNYHTLTTELIEADAPHEHTLGQWTAVDEEMHKQTCDCGHEVTEAHKWNDGEIVTEATADAEGEIRYTCTECGQTKTEKLPILVPGATDATTGDTDKKKGCGSAVSGALAIVAMTVAAGAVLNRKKKD